MQNHMENKVYAGFFVRLIAFAIDSLIAALVVSTVKSPFTMAAASGVTFLEANFLFHYSFLDVLDYVAAAAYFILLTYFTHTTPGKMAMRLEVITIDREWTLLNVIYRETIGRFFSSLLCAGYFAVLVSEKKQGFHDMFCDTYVVYKGMAPQDKLVPVMVNNTVTADVTVTESNLENVGTTVVAGDVPAEESFVEEPASDDNGLQFPQNEPMVSEVSNTTKTEPVAPVYHVMPETTDSSAE